MVTVMSFSPQENGQNQSDFSKVKGTTIRDLELQQLILQAMLQAERDSCDL